MVKQPNFLIFMVDQLNGTLFDGGKPADFLHAPNLRKLFDEGVGFSSHYCASPLCAPSRAAFMSGLLPSRTGCYDNAAEFPSSFPTFAHHLRRAGYRTTLSGKMHFVGPDQLHGFEHRPTTDVYPADFGWTPDWTKPDERIDWWYHNLGSVTTAGVAETTNQLEYDDEVAFHARQALHQMSRERDKPFCLTVSFTHPHDPYVTRHKYWDLYPEDKMPPLAVPAVPYKEQDAHSKRLLDMSDWRNFETGHQKIIDSRRAYFGNISYLDELIGGILETLKACDYDDDTIILFLSDHGDMLGERGLWFKMSFFEGSSRVPLLIHAPKRFKPTTIAEPSSNLDVFPTLVDLAGLEVPNEIDGMSLLPTLEGKGESRQIIIEYAAEGSIAPMVMLREGAMKLTVCPVDEDQLFDMEKDPLELTNLAQDPAYSETLAAMRAVIDSAYDFDAFNDDVIASQQRRLVVYDALRNGSYYPWDHQPLQLASERYMRNHKDLNVLEANARYPKFDEGNKT
ncbi:choline-sulfatase [Pseudahrensia aquimaris]|uniref:Choline-sulfatase n=1 Tax=Pseudahrensia aquimaris TaxID=744461 RepID=A0ABW3FFL8_9HYPH